MGRSYASKSKAKEKSKHLASPETRKRTSHLQKKGSDAISSNKEQKQKLCRSKKSKEYEESDQGEKETGKLQETEIKNDSSPKENRKRESLMLSSSPSTKRVPVFGKKRRSAQTSDVKERESQQSVGNIEVDTGAESMVDSPNAVGEQDSEKDSGPENASLSDKMEPESKECEPSETRAEVQVIKGVGLDSKADGEDEGKAVPENESTSHGMEPESKQPDSDTMERRRDDQPIKDADLDESKAVRAEKKNDDHLKGLDRVEMVEAMAPCVSAGTILNSKSGSKEDYLDITSYDDIESKDMGISKEEKTEVCDPGASKIFKSAVKFLGDCETADTDNGNIRGDDTTATDGNKIHSDLKAGDDIQDKKDKEDILRDKAEKILLNSSAVDSIPDKGNGPVTIGNFAELELMEPKPQLNELNQVLQVPGDGNCDRNHFQDEMENFHGEILKKNTPCEAISETRSTSTETVNKFPGIASNTSDTNRESPEINEVLADGHKVEVERLGNDETSEKSAGETGDPIFSTSLEGHLQSSPSTEDMNSPRQDNAPICDSKEPESDNQNEYETKNNIQNEIKGFQYQLFGSTQEFEVSIQGQPSCSQSGNPMLSSGNSLICGKVLREPVNILEGRVKGIDKKVVIHADGGTDDRLNTPLSLSETTSSIATKDIYLKKMPNEQGDTVGKAESVEGRTSDLREPEQGDNKRQGGGADSPHLTRQELSTDPYCSSECDPLVDDMIDLTDSQMIELDQQCSMSNQLTNSLTFCASTCDRDSGKLESKVGCHVGVQTVINSTECVDSTSIIQSIIRDLRQLNATVLDIKTQMDSFRRQRCQPSASSSSSYQQQQWKQYNRTWRKPFYKK